ncbi:MAG: hypothetical protein WB661_09455 [Candidatus Bathyarchaeia archaeon]
MKLSAKFLALLIIVFIVGALLGAAGSTHRGTTTITETVQNQSTYTSVQTLTAQLSSTQTANQGEWKTISTVTGSASKDTADFTAPTNYWRIVYTIQAQNGLEQYASFTIFVYPSSETQSFVASAALFKSGTDTTYIRAGPGDFWIKVIAANLVSWTIEVQVQQ